MEEGLRARVLVSAQGKHAWWLAADVGRDGSFESLGQAQGLTMSGKHDQEDQAGVGYADHPKSSLITKQSNMSSLHPAPRSQDLPRVLSVPESSIGRPQASGRKQEDRIRMTPARPSSVSVYSARRFSIYEPAPDNLPGPLCSASSLLVVNSACVSTRVLSQLTPYAIRCPSNKQRPVQSSVPLPP